MGYLSCKADSSVSTADTHLSTPPPNKSHKKEKKPTTKIQEFNYKDLELATNNFSETKLLGKGSHGLVYKGVLRGGRHVAIKKPSRTTTTTQKAENPNEVENEIDILSGLRSPNLVNLVGFTNNNNGSRNRLLVVEFMCNGTLYDVLHSSSRPPNWGRRIKLALQTAKAIDTLHSLNPSVIHRDIKSANVLIDRNFNARLGDFGLALRCVDGYRLRSTPPAGTMGYLDPCYVTPDNLSTKTDVFSFGILLLEIISGRKAIDVLYSPPSIVDWAIPLIRRGKLLSVYDPRILPPKDGLVRKTLAVVAAKCVRSCRERRPSMREVVECLSEMSKLVPVHGWNSFVNPCMMVENVGRPVQSRNLNLMNAKGIGCESGNNLEDDDSRVGSRLRNSRRVYSDLGFQSNLLELMAGPNGESTFQVEDESLTKVGTGSSVPSVRFEGGGSGRTRIRSMILGDGKDRSNLRRNRSVGERNSDVYCGRDDKIAGSKPVTQAKELDVDS